MEVPPSTSTWHWPRGARATLPGYRGTPARQEMRSNYPQMIVPVGHVEPVPRRVRAVLAGSVVLDTTRALYVWEWPYYPQYYIPITDVNADVLAAEKHTQHLHRGTDGLGDTVRFDWDALDAWFEEDEEVFVHPRNPYTRVDALRSTRTVRMELNGLVLAESSSPVMVFETGLPTRYYLDRTAVSFEHLQRTETVTACPYKGRTSGYWSVRVGDEIHPDLAWTYDFPARQLLPIAGLIAFYDEKVDVIVDGEQLERPTTHFSKPA